jgi:hypothetical protein
VAEPAPLGLRMLLSLSAFEDVRDLDQYTRAATLILGWVG